jgi:hypothetical protein
MADIIQAAKWMAEGKKVRRASWLFKGEVFEPYIHSYGVPEQIIVTGTENDKAFSPNCLLADDWEVLDG